MSDLLQPQQWTYRHKLVGWSVALIVIKLLALPFVHEVDADAITRTYQSLIFAHDPQIFHAGNWPPVYFYLMGTALMLYENQFVTPVVVNILLSIGLLFPLFYGLRRAFSERTAFLLCVLFSVSPIVFRLSLLAMSEIPFLFFAIASGSFLARGIDKRNQRDLMIAGVLMGLAGGIRYESWFLGVFGAVLLQRVWSWKAALTFLLPFAVIPVYWVVSNFTQTADVLNSFNWAIEAPQRNEINSLKSFARRIWWYPLALVFAFGPLAFVAVLRELRKSFKGFNTRNPRSLLLLFFGAMLLVWWGNTLSGSLLMQQRFVIPLFLLAFPFLGYFLESTKRSVFLTTTIFAVTAFFLAFAYSSKGARPIPRLLTPDAKATSEAVNAQLASDQGLILDFWNWETSYYLPFAAGLPQKSALLLDQHEQPESIKEKLIAYVNSFPRGVLIVHRERKLTGLIERDRNVIWFEPQARELHLELIHENEDVQCFSYEIVAVKRGFP